MKALKETEAEFMSWVIDCAHVHGWLVAHFRPAKTERGWRTAVSADGAGFPDLVMVKQGEPGTLNSILFVELKSDKGKLSKEQEKWKSLLEYVYGGTYFTWRPSDREKIEEILR